MGFPSTKRDTKLEISPSSPLSVFKNRARTGVLKKRFSAVISEPAPKAQGTTSPIFPPEQQSSYASAAPAARERMRRLLTEAMLASASPRKPRVRMSSRSSAFAILLVACGKNAERSSLFSMPLPSSVTWMRSLPPRSMLTVMFFAPASRLFSTNSLTTEYGLSTTSPAAMRL